MGETDFHINVILYLRQALRYIFRQTEGMYVAANMLFYYEKGDPKAVRSPDVFVVRGIAKHDRRTYKLWEERVAPCAAFEITSKSTWLEDMGTKRALYESLGIEEYFLFDPLDEYLSPRLQGFRLVEGFYRPMKVAPDGTLRSQELGVILRPEGTLLRVVDPDSGEALPTLGESMAQALVEAQRAQAEAQRAQVEAQRAQVEAQRAQAEAQRAQVEAQRADAAEASMAHMQAELDRLRRQLETD